MPRRSLVAARYAYIVECKLPDVALYGSKRNCWIRCAPPFFGHSRIAARRLALRRVDALIWEMRPSRMLRVKGIHISVRYAYICTVACNY